MTDTSLRPADLVSYSNEAELAKRMLSKGLEQSYTDWKARLRTIDNLYAGKWAREWPDHHMENGLPSIPNFIQLAIEDRARAVGGGRPSLMCRPPTLKDTDKVAAEKRERIEANYWQRSRVSNQIRRFAADAMAGGLCAVKVLPDMAEEGARRFPLFSRIDPRHILPSPTFTDGPWVESAVVAYETDYASIASRYGEYDPGWLPRLNGRADQKRVKVVEFYDGYVCAVICQVIPKQGSGSTVSDYRWLLRPWEHELSHAPIAIGTRTGLNGEYRGDFDSEIAILRTLDQFVTMSQDAGMHAVYPERVAWQLANPQDIGPDATLEALTADAHLTYVQNPGSTWSNHQLMQMLTGFLQAGSLMPPSRSGDPNESIVSAAGISAAQSGLVEHIKDLERSTIAPMLEAANELAMEADEKWCNYEKTIQGAVNGKGFKEIYKPSVDIAGNYDNSVVYGFSAGLDEVNANVLVLQQRGNGLLSKQTAQELSPLVEDPTRESKLQALEQLDEATFAGLLAKAQAGELSAEQLAQIRKDMEGGKTLHDAILEATVPAPLAAPQGTPQPAGAPGIAGAARGQQPMAPMPPLSDIMVGQRP